MMVGVRQQSAGSSRSPQVTVHTAIGLQTLRALLCMLVCHSGQFVVAGGVYSPGMSDDPLGISRSSAAGYILGGVANVLQGDQSEARPLPAGIVVACSQKLWWDIMNSSVRTVVEALRQVQAGTMAFVALWQASRPRRSQSGRRAGSRCALTACPQTGTPQVRAPCGNSGTPSPSMSMRSVVNAERR